MTRSIPPAAAPAPRRGPALTPTRDCDVCIIGDDVAGLLMACELAARGLEVVLFPTPGEVPALLLEGALAPGFALPAQDLVERLGRVDAAELFGLCVQAVRRGCTLAQEAGVPLGPKGRMRVARPHAARLVSAEHEALEGLMPESSVLLTATQTEELLGTGAFALGLGLVPAHRIDAMVFRDVLADAAAAGEITIMPRSAALETDVHGLRKYVTAPRMKVRAFHVVFSGGAALSRVAPELMPSLVPTAWVSGRFHLPGAGVPYAGLVEETGGTGLRWHWDTDRLAIAAETATRVRAAAAARVLRRHGRAVSARLHGVPAEVARGAWLAPTRKAMPLIQEGEKGVWYCATLGGEELTHAILGADLIVRAIAERDDRIRLLQPFGLEPRGARPVSRWVRMLGYWRRRLSERLHEGRDDAALPGAPSAPRESEAAAAHAGTSSATPVQAGRPGFSRRDGPAMLRRALGGADGPKRE